MQLQLYFSTSVSTGIDDLPNLGMAWNNMYTRIMVRNVMMESWQVMASHNITCQDML